MGEYSSMSGRSLSINATYNIARTFCTLIFPLLTFMYASKILLVEGIGKVEFAKNIVLYFSLLATFGINSYGAREAARVRDTATSYSKLVHELSFITLLTTTISYVIFLCIVFCMPKLKMYNDILLLFSMNIFFSAFGFEWVFVSLEEYKYITLRTILCQLISLIVLLLFVRGPEDYLIYTGVLLISSVGANLINLYYVKNIIILKWLGSYNLKRHIVPLGILFVMTMANNLYSYIDPVILGMMKDDREVGLYIAGLKVNRVVINILGAIGAVIVPRLSLLWQEGNRDKFYKIAGSVFNILLMLSIPCALGLAILSEDIINLFCGPMFKDAVITMQLLIPIVVFLSLSTFFNMHMLIPMNLERVTLFSILTGLIVNVLFNLLLIPAFARNGSAIGTLAGEFSVLAVTLGYLKKNNLVKFGLLFGKIKEYIISSLLILIVCFGVKVIVYNSFARIIISIMLSVVSYFTVLHRVFNNIYLQTFIDKIQRKLAI